MYRYIKLMCPLSDVCCVLNALIGGQTGWPYWGTNRMPVLGDKQVALIRGQTGRHRNTNKQINIRKQINDIQKSELWPFESILVEHVEEEMSCPC